MANEAAPMRELATGKTWYGRREDFEYDIFISYRRRDGLKIADCLSRRLRKYRQPRGFPRNVTPLRTYRDLERERVTPAIWDERIRPALLRSRFLILIITNSVSEQGADGGENWVIRELSAFLDAPQGGNVMLIKTAAALPLPTRIAARFPDPGWVELNQRDVGVWRRVTRRGILHDKITALAVPALDIADAEIPRFTQLAEREKRRVAWAITSVSLVLALIVSTLAALSWIQAVAARRAAIVRTAGSVVEENPTSAALLLGFLPSSNPPEGAISVAMRLTRAPLATVLRGHDLWVDEAVFTTDATHVITASGDGTLRLWRTDGVDAPRVLHAADVTGSLGSLERAIEALAIHPDGRSVAAAGGDGRVRIWRIDATQASEPRVLRGHGRSLTHAQFSPDGRLLLASGADDKTFIWPADGNAPPVVLPGQGTTFSPEGVYVVAGERNGVVRVMRSDGTGDPYVLPPLPGANALGDGGFVDAAFSPDGRSVVVAAGRLAWVWRFAESSEPRMLAGHERKLSGATFSPDGRRILTFGDDGTARIWTGADQPPVVLRGHAGRVFTARFDQGSTRVVTASEDGTARVWRLDAPDRVLTLKGHEGYVTSARFNGDGTRVVTAGADRTARIWDVGTPEANVAARYGPGTLRDARFDPDGRQILTAHTDGIARLRTNEGQGAVTEFRGHAAGIYSATFSADGRHIVTASGDGTARVWTRDPTAFPIILKFHQDAVYSAVFSPDGQSVVTASDDQTAAIWRVTGGSPQHVLKEHQSKVRSAAFNDRGTEIVTASDDGTARVWQIGSQQARLVLGKHGADVLTAAFSPDGRRVATGTINGILRMWRLDRPDDPELVWRGHQKEINSVVFSPDGTRVATASADGTAQVWRLDGSRAEAILPHGVPVMSAAFSSDGRRLITAADDGGVRVWTVDWRALLEALRSRTTACLTDEERRRYLGESPAAALRGFDQCEAGFGRPPIRAVHVPSIGEIPPPKSARQ